MKKIMFASILFMIYLVKTIDGFVELYELELEQQRLAEQAKTNMVISKAIKLIDKMKNGIGGNTIATHHPSGRMFLHRNYWQFDCFPAKLNIETGQCEKINGLEPLGAYFPSKPRDFCYIKQFNTINDTLCLSTHPVLFQYDNENDTYNCESEAGVFPVLVISIESYLKMCKFISNKVDYLYLGREDDPERVVIPNGNYHVKCDNEVDEPQNSTEITTEATTVVPPSTTNKQTKFLFSTKNKKEDPYEFAKNKPGVCLFTEEDNVILGLIEYLL